MSLPSHDSSDSDLPRIVFRQIRGCTFELPQTLAGILGGVDAERRLLLSREELVAALEALAREGLVRESGRHHYYDATGLSGATILSGISEEAYGHAVEQYRVRLRRVLGTDVGDEFDRRRLTLRLVLPGNRWPTPEDEEHAEELALAVDAALRDTGLGEVNGFELGRGLVDVLVFGPAGEDAGARLLEAVRPIFDAFGPPAGSKVLRHD